MRILHISNTDVAGGRFTGYYMPGWLPASHRAEMAVWRKTSPSASVHQTPPSDPVMRRLTQAAGWIGNRVGLDGLAGTAGWMLPHRDYFREADVVHLHLVHNDSNLSILSLPTLSRSKPLVWTIHDPWATTGGCVHSFDCDRWLTGCASHCPHPRRRSLFRRHTPHLQWRLKRFLYQRSEITLVVASRWMQERVERSPLLRNLPCYRIPFGIDLGHFKPRDQPDCRRKLGIPMGHRVIAFRDVGLSTDLYKGLRWLREALQMHAPKSPTCLLILEDGSGFQCLAPKYDVRRLGWVDGDDLAVALAAADVFVMPSIQEAFGLMAVEAMACATPVIVFEGTSLPDVIHAPKGGLAVPARDSAALAAALARILEDTLLRRQLAAQARQLAEQEYGFPLYVERHLRLYAEVIENHRRRRGERVEGAPPARPRTSLNA